MLINEFVSDEVIEQRVNALSIRSQLRNASSDRAGLLNSDKKKLAFLFLFELASNNPDLPDERSSDAWVFQEMGRLGFFRE